MHIFPHLLQLVGFLAWATKQTFYGLGDCCSVETYKKDSQGKGFAVKYLFLLFAVIASQIWSKTMSIQPDVAFAQDATNIQPKLSNEQLKEQLAKLRMLEQKNQEKLKQYENNPTASIKLKSNLVIIRLKIRTISQQLGLDPTVDSIQKQQQP